MPNNEKVPAAESAPGLGSDPATANPLPDKPGRWTLEYDLQPSRKYAATVRTDEAAELTEGLCGLVANIPEVDHRWHLVEWINANGWHRWQPEDQNTQL